MSQYVWHSKESSLLNGLSIGQNMKTLTGNDKVSIRVKNSKDGRKTMYKQTGFLKFTCLAINHRISPMRIKIIFSESSHIFSIWIYILVIVIDITSLESESKLYIFKARFPRQTAIQ